MAIRLWLERDLQQYLHMQVVAAEVMEQAEAAQILQLAEVVVNMVVEAYTPDLVILVHQDKDMTVEML